MSKERLAIFAERNPVTGAWLLSTVHGDQFIHEQYFGYTKRQAFAQFRHTVEERAKRPITNLSPEDKHK